MRQDREIVFRGKEEVSNKNKLTSVIQKPNLKLPVPLPLMSLPVLCAKDVRPNIHDPDAAFALALEPVAGHGLVGDCLIFILVSLFLENHRYY